MPPAPVLLRLLILLSMLGMALLAAFYLRTRRLSAAEFAAWGLLLVLLPLVGPFMVIACRPGLPLARRATGTRRPARRRALLH